MIALVGALRLQQGSAQDYAFGVRPRWELSSLARPESRASG
jgi:tRNA A37 threonylcarbamoyltransferase TsaD